MHAVLSASIVVSDRQHAVTRFCNRKDVLLGINLQHSAEAARPSPAGV